MITSESILTSELLRVCLQPRGVGTRFNRIDLATDQIVSAECKRTRTTCAGELCAPARMGVRPQSLSMNRVRFLEGGKYDNRSKKSCGHCGANIRRRVRYAEFVEWDDWHVEYELLVGWTKRLDIGRQWRGGM